MRKIMAALDIGNYSTKLVVAEMTKNKFNILSVSETRTLGIKKNQIISESDLQEPILTVIKDSESKLNMKISKLLVVVPSYDLEFTVGEAKINIETKNIKGSDVSKCILESYKGIIPDNMELINAIPMNFKIDNNEVLSDPKGYVSQTLSVKTLIMMAPKNSVYKILSIIDKLNIDIVDISIDAIGDYFTFKNDKINKSVSAIVNIGENKTTISIFNKGIITNLANIELGSKNIDNDIAYIYKIDLESAKKLKEEFACAYPKYASSNDEIIIRNKDNQDIKVNAKEISKIAYSRIKEILDKVKKDINYLTKKEISNIIFTGGVSEMRDFKLVLESQIEKNAVLGKIDTLGVRNNKFSSVIGLIKWYNNTQLLKDKDYSIFSIEEQEEFSRLAQDSDNSMLSKFFSYFLDN